MPAKSTARPRQAGADDGLPLLHFAEETRDGDEGSEEDNEGDANGTEGN